VQAAAHGVSLETKADQVGGAEVVKSLLARQRHVSILSIRGLRVSSFVESHICRKGRGRYGAPAASS